MKLSEYYKMINDVDGIPNPEPDPRISRKDLDFREGKGKEGAATITFLDSIPVYLNWYIWDLDHNWMIEQVEKELGRKFTLTNMDGGNGHMGADLELDGDNGCSKCRGRCLAQNHAGWDPTKEGHG